MLFFHRRLMLILLLACWAAVSLARPNDDSEPTPQIASTNWVGGSEYQGSALDCDLPAGLQMRNIGSRVDGAGMCVLTSLEHAARWQGLEAFRGLRDWGARQPGGAYPEKVDRQLAQFGRENNLGEAGYLQYEGADPRPLLTLCAKTGRMACVTYGRSPRYSGTIAHMVNVVHFGPRHGAVLDNNFVTGRADHYEWMPTEELVRRIVHPHGRAWVFVWLSPPIPPAPSNR